MQAETLDYTSTFRSLSESLRSGDDISELSTWQARWRQRLAGEGNPSEQVAAAMDQVNPIYVPRNHLVEDALAAATAGDMAPFEELLSVVTDPFTERDGLERFSEPAPDNFQRGFKTFCGT